MAPRSPDKSRLFPRALPRLARSIQTRAVVAVMLLTTGSVAVCGYLVHMQARASTAQTLIRDAITLTEAASHMIDPRAGAASGAAIDRVMRDQRIAFLTVLDADGRVLTHRQNDPVAWQQYEAHLTMQQRREGAAMARTLTIQPGDSPMIVVRREPIGVSGSPDGSAEGATGVAGYVELGLTNPQRYRLLGELRRATIGIAGGLCVLCVPLTVWWVRRWTTPLRRLVHASVRLGAGRTVRPLPVDRDDEIGLLVQSFNAMVDNLTRARAELVDANAELERKVADRTAELATANERLRREMVEKDGFIRAVSHDLGAPLRNIDGLTRTLIAKHAGAVTDDVLTKLERIAANVKQENELLDDLLELSRIKSRRGAIRPVDMEEVSRGVVGSLSYDLERSRVEVVFDTPLPAVNAERNRMRQVMQNLIDNAIKYMPEEAAERRVHIGHRRGADGRAAFYVADTGRGIAASDRQRVFEVFRRARKSGSSGVPGRGVGLAAVRAIVDCYGGSVWVESEPGRGATFWFTLDPAHRATAPDGAAGAATGSGRRIRRNASESAAKSGR